MLFRSTVLVDRASQALGSAGLIGGAALAGVVDVHASIAALGALVAGGLSAETARWAVWAALLANSVSRCLVAVGSGGWAFGRWVVGGLAGQLLAAALVLALGLV